MQQAPLVRSWQRCHLQSKPEFIAVCAAAREPSSLQLLPTSSWCAACPSLSMLCATDCQPVCAMYFKRLLLLPMKTCRLQKLRLSPIAIWLALGLLLDIMTPVMSLCVGQVWSNRSLISLLATFTAIAVGVCFVWSCLAAFLNKCFLPCFPNPDEYLSSSQAPLTHLLLNSPSS